MGNTEKLPQCNTALKKAYLSISIKKKKNVGRFATGGMNNIVMENIAYMVTETLKKINLNLNNFTAKNGVSIWLKNHHVHHGPWFYSSNKFIT